IAISTLLISWELSNSLHMSWGQALRQSLFQVSSIITTTGFASADFDRWPAFSKFILLALMFIGGCAGSTGGGIKNARLLILVKAVSRQVTRLLHPQAVVPVRLGTGVVSREVVESVQNFFFLYILILATATIYISSLGIDMLSSLSAVAATLGNVGPGFGLVGPMTNYAGLPAAAKWVLSLCMLTGRLEIYTVLVFFSIKTWRD
ncbi:MAG: potassium transporter TrkG, partial [Bacillota bacterium]